GNKTNELWRYVEPAWSMLNRPSRDGVAGNGMVQASRLVRITPNPLNGRQATLSYALPQAGPLSVRVYDVSGRAVLAATLTAGRAGSAALDLRALSAGVYLVKLQAQGFSAAQKLIVQ
ncbi:T9SS type A sorting domain-containing protein, partial [candidate division WOR-3 bacterium]|nr:T9SS type A sorting domain-containing protein [candidate division WOR-3 bacterium]